MAHMVHSLTQQTAHMAHSLTHMTDGTHHKETMCVTACEKHIYENYLGIQPIGTEHDSSVCVWNK